MEFKEFVKSSEQNKYGRSYVHFERSDYLIIVMSAHNQGERYMSLRSLFEQTEYSLLFLNNPENSWYLDGNDSYGKILEEILGDYDEDKVIIYGSSMSGYASILYALRFNLNAFSVNPQINLNLSYDYCWEELKHSLDSIPHPKIALEKYCLEHWVDSVVYILHGHDPLDRENVDLFTNARSNSKKLIINTVDSDSHDNYIGKNIALIKQCFDLIFDYRKIEVSLSKSNAKKKSLRESINKNIESSSRIRNISDNMPSYAWHDRDKYENAGGPILFSDIGLYNSKGRLSGALCHFNGRDWELVSPNLSQYNLLDKQDFSKDLSKTKLINNGCFYKDWWARVEGESSIEVTVKNGVASFELENVESKNTYVSIHPDKNKIINDSHSSCYYMTFFADVLVDGGEAFITLGGRTESAYFHSNSRIIKSGFYARAHVTELFSEVHSEHKDFIYCRIFLSPDLEGKTVKVRNPMLVEGYFPEGLIF